MTEKLWFATNASSLLETRRQGLAPDGPVVVSPVVKQFSHTALYCRPDAPAERFDWRMLVNLDVWLYANAKVPIDWVVNAAWRLAQVRPKQLFLRFEAEGRLHDVDCGSGSHRPAIASLPPEHEFLWFPLRTTGTELAQRITGALVARHPKGQIL